MICLISLEKSLLRVYSPTKSGFCHGSLPGTSPKYIEHLYFKRHFVRLLMRDEKQAIPKVGLLKHIPCGQVLKTPKGHSTYTECNINIREIL